MPKSKTKSKQIIKTEIQKPLSMKEEHTNIKELLMRISDPSQESLAPEHVKQVLQDRAKVHSYIHEDKKMNHSARMKDKTNLRWGMIILAIFLIAVLYVKPDILVQILNLIIGGILGFAAGKSKSDTD